MTAPKPTGLAEWLAASADDGFFGVNRDAPGTCFDFSPEAVAKREARDAEFAAEREARRIAEGRPCCCVDEMDYDRVATCEHCYISNGERGYWTDTFRPTESK